MPFKIKLLFLLLVLCSVAAADLKNPEIVTLRNLTMDNAGVYRCTVSNDVGEETCILEVPMDRECEDVWARGLFHLGTRTSRVSQ